MRKRKSFFLACLFIFLPFTSLFNPSPASAISFTSNDFWFFIDEPTTIDYKEMTFTITNDLDTDVQVNCSFMPITGVDLEVIFDWESTILSVGESKSNSYAIIVNSTLAVTITVEILLKQKPLVSGEQMVTSGGIIRNRVTYYTEEEGALLDLNVFDQSGWPRNASIDIQYKFNDSMSWTPIKSFVGIGYDGFLPNGRYFIRAYDLETPTIYSETTFDLTEDTTVDLVLELVGFKLFKVLFTTATIGEDNITICGLEATINNYVGTLEEVKIYAEMYENNTLIKSTLPSEFSEFPKTQNFKVALWFEPVDWKNNTKYIIRGIIQAHDLVIATKNKDFWYYTDAKPSSNQPFPLELVLVLFGSIGVALFVWKFKGYSKGKEIEKLVESHVKPRK